MTSLKKLALQGAFWTFLGYGLTQTLRFLANVILTRLLLPEYFGLMALINTFRQGLELFSDVGIGQNIVQSPRGDDPVFLDTAWTIQVARGCLIWGLCCLIALPISNFYQEPQIIKILPVISLANVFAALASVRLHSLNRHLQLRKSTLFIVAERIISLSIMIGLAWIYPNIWALVIGTVFAGIFRMVGSYIVCPGPRHQVLLDSKSRREIIEFGRWIFLSSIIVFLASQSDRLILGKLVSLKVLGVYSIAYALASIPEQLMKQISMRVIFPLISRQDNLPRPQLRENVIRHRGKLLLSSFIVFIVLVGFGDKIIEFLYDERYQAAGWMLPILALGNWFTMLYYTSNACLLGLGKPMYNAQSRFARLIVIIFGLIVGFRSIGILGAVIVIALSDLPSYLVLQYGLHKEKMSFVQQDLKLTIALVSLLLVVLGGRWLVNLGTPFSTLGLDGV
jgi:O-antigen/teichoic acid export membrane protein